MASDSRQPQPSRLVLGITGRIGSGKTTVGRYLESRYGFQYLRYSEVLAEWLAKDPESKAQLQKVGWGVMAGGMQPELNRRLSMQIRPETDVSVDGLRHELDYETLTNSFGLSFHLLYIDSLQRIRFGRLREKGKYESIEAFETADAHPVEQHIDALRTKAALVIHNGRSLPELYASIDVAVEKFRKERHS
jgi:dephospho-CoA kinase